MFSSRKLITLSRPLSHSSDSTSFVSCIFLVQLLDDIVVHAGLDRAVDDGGLVLLGDVLDIHYAYRHNPGCDHKPALMWAYKAADKDAASSRGGSSRSCCTIGWHFSDRFEAIDKDLLGAEPHPAGRRWQRRRRRRIGRWRPAPPAELPSECLSAGVWLVAGDKFEAISTRTTTGG